ncbi:DUF308 domain-containing protein [Streptomyces roseolus]|uniref:DUF308 domain-containing protein n=1 Tax=Streptomyces roseolus TaxID=67358 RepID=UPI0037BA7EA8
MTARSGTAGDLPRGPLRTLAGAAWQAPLLAGAVALVLGVLVPAWPGASLVATGVLFGLHLLFSGVMQLVAAFGTHATTSPRVPAFISGALSILLLALRTPSAMPSAARRSLLPR